jgi:PKD repeat protein
LTGAGSEATVHHYEIFLSPDGMNLAKVAELPPGSRSYTLGATKFAPGDYIAFVKAVGRPSIRNQISTGLSYVGPNQPPIASLNVSTSAGFAPLTLTASTAGSTDSDGKVVSSVINFGNLQSAVGFNGSTTYAAPGTYTVQASVTDDLGASTTTKKTVTVKSPGVTFLSPGSGGTVSSPLRVRAVANSGNPISGMWLYVDGIAVYRTSMSTIDTYRKLSKGYHDLVVKAWDSTGAIYRASVRVRVW